MVATIKVPTLVFDFNFNFWRYLPFIVLNYMYAKALGIRYKVKRLKFCGS